MVSASTHKSVQSTRFERIITSAVQLRLDPCHLILDFLGAQVVFFHKNFRDPANYYVKMYGIELFLECL